MASYWMVEPISIYMTALIPVALYPLLDIISTNAVCSPYMKGTNMMFIGGLLMAIAIENCNLHKRIALKVLLMIGTSITRIMLGIMLVTMFLSMWISNTATTAMMVPIVEAMLNELEESPKVDSPNSQQSINIVKKKQSSNNNNNNINKSDIIRKALLLSISYSANIGGTGTLTGTGTNLVLQGIYEDRYPKSSDLTFLRWFIYAAPGMLICVLVAWIFLYLSFIWRNKDQLDESKDKIRSLIEHKYSDLGSITFQETAVIIHFVILVMLWFFRQPEVFTGWSDLISSNGTIKDATPAILIAVSMFIVPANLKQFYTEDSRQHKKIQSLLDWRTVQQKMPWGVIILLGGGFAMAEGIEKSGLSEWLGQQLSHFDHVSPRVAMIFLTVIGAMVTEVASNVSCATVLLPVVNTLAIKLAVHPLLLMMPVTIGISFAFMFPVATPPNAIVFESMGPKASTFDMIKPGIVMNLLCIGIELALINSWGQFVFDLNQLPEQ
ncbi:Na(+)/citrate cotransporter-like [Oppia nitens]|uniref:Na(+)/citrate cotransporter-like n=1 Tax=Oppia nitens TaxID=1686743 RepID=UPI0023DC25F8|nr:Na(+)/citrate cotransporter-like [Oppia nitens]